MCIELCIDYKWLHTHTKDCIWHIYRYFKNKTLNQVIIIVIALLSIVWTRFCAQSFIKAFILERRPQQPCQSFRWYLHDIRNDEPLGVKDRPGTCESLFFQEGLGCKQQLPYDALMAYSMRSAEDNLHQ